VSAGETGASVGAELKALWRLAVPVTTAQLGMMTLSVVDTVMIGHHSALGLAAVALGNVYSWGLMVFGMGVLFALDPLVSQAFGAGDRDGIRMAAARGAVVALALSAALMVLFQLGGPILTAIGQPPEVVPLAAAYIRALGPSVPAFLLFIVLRQCLQATHVVRPIVAAVVVGNLANLLLNWLLIFGSARLHLPALGAVGSGISTTLARWLMLLALVGASWHPLRQIVARPTRALLDWEPYRRLFAIGTPIGVQIALEMWVFALAGLLIGRMGARPLSAHQIALNLASLSFMMPLGIGAATSTLVGNAIGRRDPAGARRAAWVGLGFGASVMSLSALAFGLLPQLLARAYTPDADVIARAVPLIGIAGVFQILDGTQAVGCGVLRGAADTRVAALINFIGYWVVGLPLGLVLAFPFGLGPRGLWWGLTVGLALVSLLLLLRIRRRF
jgi:MATE family multidrug resistance protein